MIIFMEGLPRAGKSYETCVYYILEAIKQGRPVDAYVEGLNHKMFSDLSGQPLSLVNELLQYIPKENVPTIHAHTRKDSLVVIDELQDFFPAGRQRLTPEITTFVTQHGHEGQDIIAMGQNLNDCHNLWKRRVNKKFVFQKLDMVGKPNSYSWTAFNAQLSGKDIKFIKIASGTRDYEEQYFGIYKSHSDGTSNFETFKDERVVVWNHKGIKYGIPAMFLAFIVSVWYLANTFFSTEKEATQPPIQQQPLSKQFEQIKKEVEPPKPKEPEVVTSPTVLTPSDLDDIMMAAPTEYLAALARQYRLRLSGHITKPKTGEVVYVIEAYDNSYRLKERFLSPEIVALGWDIQETDYGITLSNNDRHLVIRPWPIEPYGAVPNKIANSL